MLTPNSNDRRQGTARSREPLIRPEFLPLSLARAVWKGKLIVVGIAIIVAAAAYLYVSRIPAVYYSEALIAVNSPNVPERYVSSTVNSDAQGRLAILSQEMLNGDRIALLMRELKMIPAGGNTVVPEMAVDAVRLNIKITPDRPVNDRLTAFRVGYQGPDRKQVTLVANYLAKSFVNENMRLRETQAEGTQEFMGSQLKEAKRNLDNLESALTQYKMQHAGELPEQQNSLIGRMGGYQAEYQANTEAVTRARESRIILENSLALAEERFNALNAVAIAEASAAQSPSGSPKKAALEPPLPIVTPPDPEVQKLEIQLADLRLRYSDEHPDVRRMRATLARMREAKAANPPPPAPRPAATASVIEKVEAEPARGRAHSVDPVELTKARDRIATLQAQLTAADKDLQMRLAEQERIRQEMNDVQAKVSRLPIREQEMARVSRDYEISKMNYQSLMGKKLSAEMATDLEHGQKSERFSIIEPAKVPTQPLRPNRRLFYLMGAVAGLLLGIVTAIGLELNRGVLLGEWELPSNTLVIGHVPDIRIATVIAGSNKPA
jgi:protein tyrosine kinase modulator